MMRAGRLLIVQPWFSAIGHPAQSLFNTLRTLALVADIDYLVSEDPNFQHHANLALALGPGQRLFRFVVSGSALKDNTVRCLWHLARRFRSFREARCVLFFDMDLVTIAKRWWFLAPLMFSLPSTTR